MKNVFVSLIVTLISATYLFSQDANKIVGFWLTQEGDSQVKIFKATNGKYYGKIVWLKDLNEEDGTPKVDDKNPDAKLQTRPIMDLLLLNSFLYDENNKEWNKGTIYDPKSGNTYKCYLWFENNPEILHVKGYIGVSLIGRKVEWTREAEQRNN